MGGADVPEPTPEENAAKAAQADNLTQQTQMLKHQQGMLDEQYSQQRLLAPYLYKQAGLTPVMDDKGNITSFTATADPEQDQITANQKKITLGGQKRTLDALAGNLPVDAGTERNLGDSEQALRNRLQAQLGTDYETSSAGIQALAENTKRSTEIRDAARRGDLTLGEQLVQSSQGTSDAAAAAQTARITNPNQFGLQFANAYGSNAAGYGNASAGYGNLSKSYFDQRQLQAGVASQNAAGNTQMASAAMGAVAAVGGAAVIF